MMLVHLMHASRSARAARLASSWLLELLVIGATESVVFIFVSLIQNRELHYCGKHRSRSRLIDGSFNMGWDRRLVRAEQCVVEYACFPLIVLDLQLNVTTTIIEVLKRCAQ